jgi:omega-6 fatty acid desaturase (delta-12 desaturase)
LLGVASSVISLAVACAALALNPFWWLLPPLWFLAGTAGWGLYVIGHECGHGSFSRSRRLNHVVGHVMLTPFLYPFHSWRLLHNRHHANTNSIEKDIDWRPLPAVVYRKLPWRSRNVYRLIRTAFWWAGTLHQWATMAFDLRQFPEGRERRRVGVSIVVVLVYAAAFFTVLVAATGLWGLVKYWLVPWLVAHGWFSTITLTHHTHPGVPFLDQRRWSPVAASLSMTMYCRYPRWTEFLGHDINVHIPHHVAPSIPFYHLRRAHAALQERWPDLVRETRFSWRHLGRLLADCNLYDSKTEFYLRFADVRQPGSAPSRDGG